MESKAKAMDMKEWKGMAKDILFGDLPDMDNIFCVLNEIPLGEDGSFWLARGPGGINKKGRVIIRRILLRKLRRVSWKQFCLRERSPRIDTKDGLLSGDRSNQSLLFSSNDNNLGIGVLQKIVHFILFKTWIEDHRDGPDLLDTKMKHYLVHTLGHKKNGPVPFLKSHFHQGVGHSVGNLVKRRKGQLALQSSFSQEKDGLLFTCEDGCR